MRIAIYFTKHDRQTIKKTTAYYQAVEDNLDRFKAKEKEQVDASIYKTEEPGKLTPSL